MGLFSKSKKKAAGGMGIFDGDSFAEMLVSQKANCIKCGVAITFEEGASFAKSKGIPDNVVMCKKCKSVFTVHLVPGGMTLTQDVTDRFR